jgi:malonyl-CoA/methylmalonyl-CoA synthetase
MHLTALFDASLRERANRPALEYFEGSDAPRTLTFGEVDARAGRMAHELASRGLRAGDRLCAHLANRVEFIDLFLACTRLGVIFVPINMLYRERELSHIIADSEPKAVVVDGAGDAPALSEANVKYPNGATLWPVAELATAAEKQSPERADALLDGQTPALIIYTSGTTGTAKGAVLSHGNLAANARNLVDAWRITDTDRYLAVLPLFHVHGLANGLCSWLLSGCFMRLLERFDQKTAAAQFRDFKPTLFFGVPTVYVRLMDTDVISAADARAIESHMRLFVSGSAPLSSQLFNQFRDRFGHAILERYGMSEALMIISNPYDGERRAGTVGKPLPGVQVRIVSEDGEALKAPELDDYMSRTFSQGSGIGELQIKSPALFISYWRNEKATNAAFTRDGWFRTGDLGEVSFDGYYTLSGRNHDLIISGGFNVYPREIEDVLVGLGMQEAAVVGIPDPLKGEVPVAYVVSKKPFDAVQMLEVLKIALASFKIPRSLIRLDALPRNAMGKIQKHLLPPWKP